MIRRYRDLAFIVVASPLLLPILGIAILFVFFGIGRPVFYRQMRGGLNCSTFEVIKLRSMTNARDVDGKLLPDAKRLTKLGKFLRSSSIDELPCLWNVIRGEMSLVGPRPFIASYLPLYSDEQLRRHNVLPGITGWAQVNGRNAISWEEKFSLDIWYVDNCSHWLDIKILVMTIQKVISREGVRGDNGVTMSEFTGTPS
ncbi:sugar transferase [Sphingorhabdus sp. Alg231-15]|uniref:sugar transferase n=1 Tax=Sphingorhabdus sp. Alg231-15 TaxID=1922222 RepID=UPI000D54C56F